MQNTFSCFIYRYKQETVMKSVCFLGACCFGFAETKQVTELLPVNNSTCNSWIFCICGALFKADECSKRRCGGGNKETCPLATSSEYPVQHHSGCQLQIHAFSRLAISFLPSLRQLPCHFSPHRH